MKAKLLALWSKVQPLASSLYAKSPLAVGICLGYVFKPEIKFCLDMSAKLLKHLL